MRSDESEGRVVVEGVASAPNACYTALVSLGRTGDGGDGSDGTTTEGAVTR